MGLPVDEVIELVGPDSVFDLLRQTAGDLLVVVGILVRHRRDRTYLGTEYAQKVHFFLRLGLRNDDLAAITTRGADMRQPDAGVAGGALHHRAAGLEHTTPLGVLDDIERRAVFHRSARIQELRLTENFASGLRAELCKPDQRRVADAAGETILYIHDAPLHPVDRDELRMLSA